VGMCMAVSLRWWADGNYIIVSAFDPCDP